MKKLVLVAALGLAAFATTHAQIRLGATLGLSNANAKLNGIDQLILDGSTDSLSLNVTGGRYGVHFGLTARVKILALYVQPGLIFSTSGMDYEVKDLKNAGAIVSDIKKESFFNADIPIMVGTKLGPLRVQVGPIASLVLANNSDLLKFSTYKDNWDAALWSAAAGVGIDIKKISLDVNYETGISKLVNQIEFEGQTYDLQTNRSRLVFLLTYRLIGD